MTLPLAKYNMVPKHGLSNDFCSALLLYMPNPELFFDAVEKGSIKLVKSPSYTFYEKGIAAGNGQEIEADVVIYATGFNGVEKLKSVFESPKFGHYIADSPRVPLYRFIFGHHILKIQYH